MREKHARVTLKKIELDYEIKPKAWEMAEYLLGHLPAPAKILIFPHVRADGDSYGSSLALALAVQSLGYEPLIYLDEEVDFQNQFFPLGDMKRIYDPLNPEPDFVKEADLAWMLDCSELSRLGDRLAAWESIEHQMVTDHHWSAWENSERIWIDTTEPAVASMIHDLILSWELQTGRDAMNLTIANALFAGLLTDTGRFTYSNVSTRTFMQAAQLKQVGVDQEALTERFFELMRRPRLEAYGEIVRTLELFEGGRVAVAYLDDAFQLAHNTTNSDFVGLVSWLRQLEGVDLSVLLTETEGIWRGSCRSNQRADARALAQSFDGGGHLQAAGFTYGEGEIEDILASIRERASKFLK